MHFTDLEKYYIRNMILLIVIIITMHLLRLFVGYMLRDDATGNDVESQAIETAAVEETAENVVRLHHGSLVRVVDSDMAIVSL